jgi:hypothetical protein
MEDLQKRDQEGLSPREGVEIPELSKLKEALNDLLGDYESLTGHSISNVKDLTLQMGRIIRQRETTRFTKYGDFTSLPEDISPFKAPNEALDEYEKIRWQAICKLATAILSLERLILSRQKDSDLDSTLGHSKHRALTAVGEVDQDKNPNGVSLEKIDNLLNRFEFRTGIDRDKAIQRLKSSLTEEQLRYLEYFQEKGHSLDAVQITESGTIAIASCSEESPLGHRGLDYYEITDFLQGLPGVEMMSLEQFLYLKGFGMNIDPKPTYSFIRNTLESDQKRVRSCYKSNDLWRSDKYMEDRDPKHKSPNCGVRFWIEI